MKKQAYQIPEIRDASNNIIQAGTYGRTSPLVNADNTGVLDYINNNLEALHDALLDDRAYIDTVSKKADTQADWNSTDSSSIDFIKNIPESIKSIGKSNKFRIKTFTKNDNLGHPTYKIIEELTNYHPKNRPSNWKTYGFSIVSLCDIRDGNGGNLEPVFMYASLGYEYDMLKSTSSTEFPVVLYNIESDKYYVAIRTTGSYKTVNLIGEFAHPDIELGEEILAQDSNGTPPSGWELTYKPQSMLSMKQLQVGMATKAEQDASGNVIADTYAKKAYVAERIAALEDAINALKKGTT